MERYAWFPHLGLSAAERQMVIEHGVMRHRGVLLSIRGDMKLTRWA